MANDKKLLSANIKLPEEMVKSLMDGWNTVVFQHTDYDYNHNLVVDDAMSDANKTKKFLGFVGNEINSDMSIYTHINDSYTRTVDSNRNNFIACKILSDNKKDASFLLDIYKELDLDGKEKFIGTIQIVMPEDKLNHFVKNLTSVSNEFYDMSLSAKITDKEKGNSPFIEFYKDSFAPFDEHRDYFIFNSKEQKVNNRLFDENKYELPRYDVFCNNINNELKSFDPLLAGAIQQHVKNPLDNKDIYQFLAWKKDVFKMREEAFNMGKAFKNEDIIAKKAEIDKMVVDKYKKDNSLEKVSLKPKTKKVLKTKELGKGLGDD